ncbi:MAG: Hsp20 family protein [Paracoccaceae bacterium]|nr:Hsp20 family protein [Paracoccaceae bacterium]
MSRISFASQPFLLGFEQLDRLVERTLKTGSDGYPPYNIEQTGTIEQDGADAYRITLAVAGFSDAELSITVEQQQLIVKGRQPAGTAERAFLHQGIAARPFQRSFVLAEGVEVAGANLENGLLHVDLTRRQPEQVVQQIEIDVVS